MKKYLFLLLLSLPYLGNAQSETIQKWHKKYDNAFVMFFYHSTLNMLNMQNNEEFQDIIKDIDKMKLITIDKKEDSFTTENYKELVSDYKSDKFEELMSMRQESSKINAYIKEIDGITKGIAVLINSDSSMTIIDLKGSVPLNKIGTLAKQIQTLQ
ncbi:MAG: DUF4252 domain-containing protein [Cyclobacteriaceae bacterium]|nr:DUF4252 domain-containing protein [Cyclobacteriaceae bacterium]